MPAPLPSADSVPPGGEPSRATIPANAAIAPSPATEQPGDGGRVVRPSRVPRTVLVAVCVVGLLLLAVIANWLAANPLIRAQAHTLAAGVLQHTIPNPRTAPHKSLLLASHTAVSDAQSPSLGQQFTLAGWPDVALLGVWLLTVEILGLITFPLTHTVFPGLHDRGWGVSRLLGMLLLGYLVWLPASLALLPFARWTVDLAVVVLALAGLAAGWLCRTTLLTFWRTRWKTLLGSEIVFLAATLFLTWIRAQDPSLFYFSFTGEKPFDLKMIDGILRSRTLPPLEPWFSGGYINYYYYGQFLVATLIKLTGAPSPIAYNLALATLYGATFAGAYAIVSSLTRRWWGGLAGGFALLLLGNLQGFQQALAQIQAALAHRTSPAFDYVASTKVVPLTDNEFPYWSYLFGDLHSHVFGLALAVLILACCASFLMCGAAEHRTWWRNVPTLGALALAIGTEWITNTWDLPTYALLVTVVVALSLFSARSPSVQQGWRAARYALTWRRVCGYVLVLAGIFATAYVLFLPFHQGYQNFIPGGADLVSAAPRTTNDEFVILFGAAMFVLVSYFAAGIYDRLHQHLAGEPAWEAIPPLVRALGVAAGWGALLVAGYRAGFLHLMVGLFVVGVVLALNPRHTPLALFTYLLFLLGLLVAIVVQVLYIRDFSAGAPLERFNTVFKFYLQVWSCLSLGAALAFVQLTVRLKGWQMQPLAARSVILVARVVWLGALALLVLGSSVFLVEGTAARLHDPQVWAAAEPPPGGVQPAGLSLDGMAYMRGWYPSDYAAITWMNDHISGAPTIVEATSFHPYTYFARVSTYTGLPTVVGWASHMTQERYPDQVLARLADVQHFWSTSDSASARAFLRRYDVRYVYLGTQERTCYTSDANGTCQPLSPRAQAKFEALVRMGVLRPVYHNAQVVIYAVA